MEFLFAVLLVGALLFVAAIIWQIVSAVVDFAVALICLPFQIVFAIIDALFPSPNKAPQPQAPAPPPSQPESRYTPDWASVSRPGPPRPMADGRPWTTCGGDNATGDER